MDLNQYGAACRCLLRVRENAGEAGLSDAAFIARFSPRYPHWRDQPGATDAFAVLELARELRLAGRIEFTRDYERVLQEHAAGQSILVCTERVPDLDESKAVARRFVMLLVSANEKAFTVWCPFPSGQSDLLPTAARACWDRWLSIGIILYRPES